MKRYNNLFRLILEQECRRLVEIGVFDGIHARRMIETAQIYNDEVDYWGFDLFEEFDATKAVEGFSKIPPSIQEVAERLKPTGANWTLYRGDSRETLPANLHALKGADFVFIDGGHSLDVIEADWSNIQQIMSPDTIVVFDDYYIDPAPIVERLGCNALIESLDRNVYDVAYLEPVDSFQKQWGVLNIQMVMVTRK